MGVRWSDAGGVTLLTESERSPRGGPAEPARRLVPVPRGADDADARGSVSRCSRSRRAGFDYDRLVALIQARIALVPRYRQRVRGSPGSLANPVWVDDEDFDIAYHVRRPRCRARAPTAQLRELVARRAAARWTATARCGRCTSSRG